MSSALDHAIVAAALVVSIGYALLSLGPRGWRRRALSRLAAWASRAPAAVRLRGFAARLEAAAGRSAACGGCDSCASGETTQATGDEIKIPIGHIGRRR